MHTAMLCVGWNANQASNTKNPSECRSRGQTTHVAVLVKHTRCVHQKEAQRELQSLSIFFYTCIDVAAAEHMQNVEGQFGTAATQLVVHHASET